jgi:hypothetical protein
MTCNDADTSTSIMVSVSMTTNVTRALLDGVWCAICAGADDVNAPPPPPAAAAAAAAAGLAGNTGVVLTCDVDGSAWYLVVG